MPRYRAFVDAIQWTGTNVIEIRQFVNNSGRQINQAVVTDGILYVLPAAGFLPGSPYPVQVGEWVVIDGSLVTIMTNVNFILKYELDI